MIKTEYSCDLCKTKVGKNDLWTMGVVLINGAHDTVSGYHFSNWKTKHACRSCVERMGLLPVVETKDEPKPPEPPTFEELVRAIVREEMGQ
jgi:hypothetical protein